MGIFLSRLRLIPALAAVLAALTVAGCGGGQNTAALPDASALADSDTLASDGDGAGADADTETSRKTIAGARNSADVIALSAAQTLDRMALGDSSSESEHSLTVGFVAPQATVSPIPTQASGSPPSDVLSGQFGLPARRLLPRTPNADYYGGELRFTMAVDPVKPNYFTLKTWGSDKSSPWLVLEVEGREIGGRHGGSMGVMFHQTSGWYPGGFVYRTRLLPFHLTKGKSSVKVRLRSLGPVNYYSSNVYDARQSRMNAPSIPLYAVYTHTGAQLDVSGEQQGALIAGTARPTEDIDAFLTSWKARVNDRVNAALNANPGALKPMRMQFLAQSHATSWSVGYRNPKVVAQVRNAMDALTRAYSAAPSSFVNVQGNDSWGGYLGEAGEAVRLLVEPLGAELDAPVDYGGSLSLMPRRLAWAKALRAGVDAGRMSRQSITNQALWNAWRVYLGNRALLAIQPDLALKDTEARRYLYEAVGISPFLGNDLPGGGDTPLRGTPKMGANYFMVTTDGTTKEDCLVGGDYGELGGIVMRWAVDANDPLLHAQALKMLRARAPLHYPSPHVDGYQAHVVADAIGCRNSHQVAQNVAYLGRPGVEDLVVASQGPELVGADLVGYVQQAMAEGNFLSRLGVEEYASMRVPDMLERLRAMRPTGVKMPMDKDQPDFAWGDRENMVIAAKVGEERLWATLFWGYGKAVNRMARVFVTTPQNVFNAEVMVHDVQYTPAGRYVTGSDAVAGMQPPDNPTADIFTYQFPVAMRADMVSEPEENRDSGRADAYTLRYGRWLIGLNAHPSRSYQVKMPPGFQSAVDIGTGTTYSGTVTIGPRSHVVFHLPNVTAAAVVPANPLAPAAAPNGAGSVTLGWDAAPGARRYVVSRAEAPNGPFVPVSGKLSKTTWTHAGASGGYYQVHALDAQGNTSGPSPAVTPMRSEAVAKALDSRWLAADIGTTSAAGTSAIDGKTVTVQSAGRDIWGQTDSFHYVYQPLAGNTQITVRVASQALTNVWARAGLMIRASLTPESPHTSIFVSGGNNGAEFSWRRTNGNLTQRRQLAGYAAPAWLRLTREGGDVTGEASLDGKTWVRVWRSTVNLPPVAYVGLAVTSATDRTRSQVVFDKLKVQALP